MDDTINIVRNPNLSVNEEYYQDDQDQEDNGIVDHFGSKLIEKFEDLFDTDEETGSYICNPALCKLKFMLDYNYNKEDPEMNDHILSTSRFSHSFRYSVINQDPNKSHHFINAQSYLKDLVRNNITMKDFREFYMGYYFQEGILNAYLRVLDVFNELKCAKLSTIEVEPETKIKIFETSVLDELLFEKNTGNVSEELTAELDDFFEYDVLIVALMNPERYMSPDKHNKSRNVNNRCLMFVIEMVSSNEIVVKLHSQRPLEDDEDDAGRILLNLYN